MPPWLVALRHVLWGVDSLPFLGLLLPPRRFDGLVTCQMSDTFVALRPEHLRHVFLGVMTCRLNMHMLYRQSTPDPLVSASCCLS